MSTSKQPAKKTIYVDVDDEITGIIDKVRSANESIVALVVPKRGSVFTSAVNLKLIKRSADQNKKKVVLITSSKTVLPVAGLVGLHAANSLNSKPYIPKAPEVSEKNETPPEEKAIEIDPTVAAAAATATAAAATLAAKDEVPSIEVDNEKVNSENAKDTKKKKDEQKKGAATKSKKLKVPNFNRFRVFLIAGIALLVFLIGFSYWAIAIAPNATVNITGETDSKDLSFTIKANTETDSLNQDKAIVPASVKKITKVESESVKATGEKNNGNKASGTLTLKNCSRSDGSVNIPAGTGVSSGELTYVFQEGVKLNPSIFSGGGNCISGTKDVSIIAQEGGEKYNIEPATFAVAGFSGVEADGSAMTGGTDDIVTVVTESDVDSARLKLEDKSVGSVEELKASLNAEGFVPIEDTFNTDPGAYVPTPAVDSEATEVVVRVENTYTMMGVKRDDLKTLIKFEAEKDEDLDTETQSILDDGLSKATYQLGATEGSTTDISINTKIVLGPVINQDAIKTEIAGMKRGVAEQSLKDRPGITEVIIDTKPFWNYSIPSNVDKITIVETSKENDSNQEQQPSDKNNDQDNQ